MEQKESPLLGRAAVTSLQEDSAGQNRAERQGHRLLARVKSKAPLCSTEYEPKIGTQRRRSVRYA